MKTEHLAIGTVALLLAAAPALAQEPEKPAEEAATATAVATHIMVEPSAIEWGAAPDVLPAGAQAAILEGDPSKEGPFTLRFRVPDGYRVPPHTHPILEHVTVISGTLGIGFGETFDPSLGRTIGAGGFSVVPPETAHFAWMEGETELQIHGIGPWGLSYVNPEDDPRNAAPEGGEPESQ